MKPSLQFSVPCLEVKDDQGPPIFSRIFYELPFPNFPFKCPPFFINNGWSNGTGNHRESTRILAPDKRNIIIQTGDHPFTLSEQNIPFMAVNLFADVVFKEVGTYWIQVFLDDEMVLEYPLTIRQANTSKENK